MAVVRGMFDALRREDGAAALAAFDPDVEWDGTNLPDGTVSRGRQAVVDHMARWRETWQTWEIGLEKVIDAGEDRVIAFTREHGRTKAGIEVDAIHSELYVVKRGKIVYRKGFYEADDALAEVGLSDSSA